MASTLAAIEAEAITRGDAHDAAHDALHLRRVVFNAQRIAGIEARSGNVADSGIVEAACWLHDLVQLPKGQGPPGESARLSATAARDLLATHSVAEPAIDAVCHAVEAHSFSGGLRPATLEAAIVQDADRLDALGAVGMARLWVTGATLGGLLYEPDDPAGMERELDDRAYGLDHIERKLLRLPELMNTEAGRREAERRAEFVRVYRDAFLREIGAESGVLDSRA